MKHAQWMIVAMLLGMGAAQAADDMRKYDGPPKSRQEAITRAQAMVTKLESMSDEEWAEKRQHRMERREKRAKHMHDKMDHKAADKE